MTRPPPRSTHTDTPVPYPTPFRSLQVRWVLPGALRSQQRHEFGERLRDPARLRGIGGVEEDHQHVHGMTLGGQPPAEVVATGRLAVLPHDARQIVRASCRKECVRTCRSRWWPTPYKKKLTQRYHKN